MKRKTKITLAAALAAGTVFSAGCTDDVQTLYGPPPSQQSSSSETQMAPTLYGPPPADEIKETVFGADKNIDPALYDPPGSAEGSVKI